MDKPAPLPPGLAGQVIVAMAKAMAESSNRHLGRIVEVPPTPWERMNADTQASWITLAQVAWAAIGEKADLFWDAKDPEYSVASPEDALDGVGVYSIVEIDAGIRTWTRFYVDLPFDSDGDGEPDGYEIKWFATKAEAEAAVARAKEAANG